MIDWGIIDWNLDELRGVDKIEIIPTINADESGIAIQVNWSNGRQDVHIQILKMPPMCGEIGE